MSKQITNQDQKGFTIIEVLIVLAIAALILLVVFLAIPGLQRSNRNSSRKSDIGKIAASISIYNGNSNGIGVVSSDSGLSCSAAYNLETKYAAFKGTNFPPDSGTNCSIIAGQANSTDNTKIDNTLSGLYVYVPNSGTPATTITTVTTGTPVVPATNVVVMEPGFVCTSTGQSGNTQKSGANANSVALVYTTETGNGWTWNCLNA
ncbi:MAG: prepilin-type N-terminal cleavage/methylation domain-containing protein [Candidatus Saccharibacteria bacterium]